MNNNNNLRIIINHGLNFLKRNLRNENKSDGFDLFYPESIQLCLFVCSNGVCGLLEMLRFCSVTFIHSLLLIGFTKENKNNNNITLNCYQKNRLLYKTADFPFISLTGRPVNGCQQHEVLLLLCAFKGMFVDVER